MQTQRKGQALIELAVFGSIFLMIVGAMLSYGLRYNYMQRAQQIAYRRAMHIASDGNRGSGSYTYITDKVIPDPVDPFAIGSQIPIMASASVTRSGRLDAQPQTSPDVKEDLPITVVDIDENQINGNINSAHRVYANAGFRYEYPVGGGVYNTDQISKYRMLYGDALQNGNAVRVTDGCSGEVLDYASCYAQATRLVDNDFCAKYCLDVSAGDVNCYWLCSDAVQLNPPNQVNSGYVPVNGSSGGGPWYVANYVRHSQDADHPATWYTFPVLDDLFKNIGSKGLGFQPDADKEQVRDTSVRRVETSGTAGSVVTHENVAWSDTSHRSFVYNNNLDSNGVEINRPTANDYTTNVSTDVYVSQAGGKYTETWTTGK
jgi:hypothetical protein